MIGLALAALVAGACGVVERWSGDGTALDTGSMLPCELPEPLPPACVADAGDEASAGAWQGSFCIDVEARYNNLPLHDVCQGEVAVWVEPGEELPWVGEGSCSFEGGRVRPIRPFLPDSYPGTMEGSWSPELAWQGTSTVYTDWGPMGGTWSAIGCPEVIWGALEGTDELAYEEDTANLTWTGVFTLSRVPAPATRSPPYK